MEGLADNVIGHTEYSVCSSSSREKGGCFVWRGWLTMSSGTLSTMYPVTVLWRKVAVLYEGSG